MVPRGEVGMSAPALYPSQEGWTDAATEKASIDEAFLDLTPMAIERLLVLHPYLATVPDDAPEGLDSDLPPAPPINWAKAGNVFPLDGETDETATEGDVEDGEGDRRSDDGQNEHGLGSQEHRVGDTWEDWALCIGAEIMAELRAEVFKRLHYTCSAVSCLFTNTTDETADNREQGIAHNKAMAKVG